MNKSNALMAYLGYYDGLLQMKHIIEGYIK